MRVCLNEGCKRAVGTRILATFAGFGHMTGPRDAPMRRRPDELGVLLGEVVTDEGQPR